jgi:two-component system, OmpR family, response regulator
VVDDHHDERHQLIRALRDAGYHTVGSASAADATRRAPEYVPDLSLLEMVLGNAVVGPNLARQLRAGHDPLVMFTTRHDSVRDKLAAYAAGADDYVLKPYAMDELLARVRAVLRRGGLPQLRQVGRLVVDEMSHRATLDDAAVDLGPTDVALLEVLAHHAGQVLSKSRLLELVWGYDAVDDNLVEVHISILRRRLGKAGAGLIQTIRGVGYVLRDQHSGPAD